MTALRKARTERGLPQTVTSKLARISQSALSGYERGERPVPATVAARLAKVLRVEIGTIFTTPSKEVRR